MSRNIPEVNSTVVLSDHIVNANRYGEIHIAIGSAKRMKQIKRAFPGIPRSNYAQNKFCSSRQGQFVGSASGLRHTENPNMATCGACLKKAKEWGYDASQVNLAEGKFRLSKTSCRLITNWIPSNIKIVIGSKSMSVVDELTNEELPVDTVDKASALIAEKCFQPFSPDNIVSDQSLFSKKIYDFNNGQFVVQGLNFDDQSKRFDGFILKSAKNNHLINLTFAQLFISGFHFEDGAPCGDYVKDRQPFVSSEVETMGLDFLELDSV